jgi:hypothetical protein
MKNFLNEFGTTILTSSIITTLITLLLNTILKEGIMQRFRKGLVKYKHDLDKIVEKRKSIFERKIYDFTQYSSKKHEVFPAIYKQTLIAKSYIFSMRGHYKDLTFEEYNKEDISAYLTNKKIPNGKIQGIINNWDLDRDLALLEMRRYLKLFKYNEAEDELIKARNLFLEFELYMDEDLSDLLNTLIGALTDLFTIYELGTYDMVQNSIKIREEIQASFDLLKKKLKKELSVGDYE